MTLDELFVKKNCVKLINRKLIELSDENPEFVYSDGNRGCNYNSGPSNDPDSCDGCIFGQALQRLGISKEELDIRSYIDSIAVSKGMSLPPRYWREIQFKQDSGTPWGNLFNKEDLDV